MSEAPPWSTSGVPPWSTATRPLSDIRELTEPSLLEVTNRKPLTDPPDSGHRRKCSLSRKASLLSRKGSLTRKDSLSRKASLKRAPSPAPDEPFDMRRGRSSPVKSPSTDRSSVYSVPSGSVPPRSSSNNAENRGISLPPRGPSWPPAPPRGLGYTIPNRGESRSPVREFAARLDPVTSDSVRRVPSRTFTRDPSMEMLEFPSHRHPRVSAEAHLTAPLYVGGGSLEGHVRVVIDDAERTRHKRALAIARISVDLLGIEEMYNGKRDVFLNLATELIDSENPPPYNMVESAKQISPLDTFWLLHPSVTLMPFCLSLPLDVGPPPFKSKLAQIRHVLCVTLLIRDKGVQYLVRSSQEVSVLSVYDPEKALASLPSPLTASDEFVKPKDSGVEVVKVTAGLHRQVWVSGTSIFVDVHIANNSRKTIRKMELQLERDILCYKHTAAATLEKSASQARIFDSNERTILTKTWLKPGNGGWTGIPAHSTETRTCDLELPRGHATVKCGKFFEVRYFLNITVSSSHTYAKPTPPSDLSAHVVISKLVSVQLPIVLIHMNSLDVVPNSVAQVAAAIEEKRHQPDSRSRHLTRRPSTSVQGRAFAAPRLQSLDRKRAEAQDLEQIGHILDHSPRKYVISRRRADSSDAAALERGTAVPIERVIRRVQSSIANRNMNGNDGGLVGFCYEYDAGYHTPPPNRSGRVMETDSLESVRHRLRHVRSNETNRSHRTDGTLRTARSASRHRRGGPSNSSGASHTVVGGGVGSGNSITNNGSGGLHLPIPPPPPPPPMSGFREAEMRIGEPPIPFPPLSNISNTAGNGAVPAPTGSEFQFSSTSAAGFKARLDATRERQFQFRQLKRRGVGAGRDGGRESSAGGTGPSSSTWRGFEWLVGDRGAERERERQREREKEKERERKRGVEGWF